MLAITIIIMIALTIPGPVVTGMSLRSVIEDRDAATANRRSTSEIAWAISVVKMQRLLLYAQILLMIGMLLLLPRISNMDTRYMLQVTLPRSLSIVLGSLCITRAARIQLKERNATILRRAEELAGGLN